MVPKGRISQLRAYEATVTGSLDALSAAVLTDCANHKVGTDEWKTGIVDELRFWWHVMARRLKSPDAESFKKKFLLGHKFEPREDFRKFDRDTIEALDIGCALFPAIGKDFGKINVNVTAADPLASGYNRLMDLFGIERSYDLVFGVAEQTADIFGDERFDFILAQNSIDHSYDPATAFAQISRALRKGGVARFEHFTNEAENQNYQGFHKWNLEPNPGDRIRVWNREIDTVFDFSNHGCKATVSPYRKQKNSGAEVDAFSVRVKKL